MVPATETVSRDRHSNANAKADSKAHESRHWNRIRGMRLVSFQRSLHEARLMFRDKETRALEAALIAAVPISILIAVAMVPLTYGWFG